MNFGSGPGTMGQRGQLPLPFFEHLSLPLRRFLERIKLKIVIAHPTVQIFPSR